MGNEYGINPIIFAKKGVKMACELLGIEEPHVTLFESEDLDEVINAWFDWDTYEIAFNDQWLNGMTNPLEIFITCLHECRHVFQYHVINGTYKGKEVIAKEKVDKWREEFNDYSLTKGIEPNDERHRLQLIEIDAVYFAHEIMLKEFKVKTIIPDVMKEYVKVHGL